MKYDEWLKAVSVAMTGDPLWTVEAYRLTQIIRLLLRMVPDQRGATFHEESPNYHADSATGPQNNMDRATLDAFLQSDAPLP